MFANPAVNICDKIYSKILWVGGNLQSVFLLLVRIIWGHQFFHTGYQKLLNMDQTIAFFSTLSLPDPVFYAYLTAYVELICGFLLLVGFASRLAAIPLIIAMMAAIGLAHNHVFSNLHFLKDPSLLVQEAPFPLLIASLIVFIFGPGRISLDGWIKRLSRNWPQY